MSQNTEAYVSLYKSLVRPHLEYCVIAVISHVQERLIQTGTGAEKDAKTVGGMESLSSKRRLNQVGLISLAKRRVMEGTIALYKCKSINTEEELRTKTNGYKVTKNKLGEGF